MRDGTVQGRQFWRLARRTDRPADRTTAVGRHASGEESPGLPGGRHSIDRTVRAAAWAEPDTRPISRDEIHALLDAGGKP
jgi:penicillin V acylase-like amidase (Ntn superfamily)